MKNLSLFVLTVFIFSCSSNNDSQTEDTELLGKWKLTEQLADPGDGSGVFVEINSYRVIEFFSDDTVVVNGDLCHMSSEVGSQNSGNFLELIDNEYYDGEIIPNDCNLNGWKIFYLLEENSLILWYPCIEGCGQKFIKI